MSLYIPLYVDVCIFSYIDFPFLLSILVLCILVGVNLIVLGYPGEQKGIEKK